ncbi:dihydrolipoyl dehydrogenase [Acidaminobacterium chupaoyuni]
METTYQLIVIGAGPGGYVAAIRAAQLGLKTAVIENREVGGTCLNRGCIPTKSLLHAAELYHEASANFETLGLHAAELSYDAAKMQDRKNEVVAKLRGGVEQLFKSDGVAQLAGTGTILDEHTVLFTPAEGEALRLTAEHVLIATGSVPSNPPVEGMDLPGVITSDELLDLTRMPEHLIVAGAGVIGMEFASLYNALGKQVTVMASRDRILPKVDKEVAQNLTMILKKRGVQFYTKARLKKITPGENGGLDCWYLEGETFEKVSGDCVLLAAGRSPNTAGLFGEGFSVDRDEKGAILVDGSFRTNHPNIYAIGDVIPGVQLAHVASAQGICAVEAMLGKEPSIRLDVIPDCIYTSPEIASVGLTEEQAKEQGRPVKVGKFSMMGNGKSMLSLQDRGFIKVIYDEEENRLLGAQLMCARATDLVNELSTAIVNRLSPAQLAAVIRPHPTFGEAVTEAVEDLEGLAIHIAKKRR